MAYDADSQQVVLFGGESCTVGTCAYTTDTWTWDGTNWTQQHPAHNPPAWEGASMAYDAATGTVVLYIGEPPASAHLDTYTWDGSQYHYNWSTKGLTAGEYRIYANLADGLKPYVDICLTK